MAIEKEKFFEIINEVGENEGLDKDNLLERIESKLGGVNSGVYSNYNNLKIDKIFSVLDSSKIVNYTLLHFAVECGNVLIVKLLLEKGVKVIDEPILELDGVKSKLTALHIAASNGHQEIIQLLLDAKANPLLENSEGKIPRAMVCNTQNREIIIKMLEEGEQLYAGARRQASRRYSLLQPNNEASKDYRNNEQTSSSSIINENNINKVDDTLEREQALRERNAVAEKLQKAEQQLANNQKRIKQTDSYNRHPEQYYTTHNGEQISLNRINSNDSGVYFDEDESQALGQSILEDGGDINAQDENGWTHLYRAVESNSVEMVKYLVEHGANVEAIDKDGRTPLHFAVALSDLEVAKLLIKGGANIKAQDKDRQSILHYAATRDNIEIVKYLIKRGADVRVQNDQKQYPLDIANINHCTKIAKFLQEAIERKRKTKSREGRSIKSNDELNLSNGSNDKVEILGAQSLKEARKELTRLKNCVVGHETRLEVLDKLSEENQSLKQKTQDLKSENATLKDELERIKGRHSNDLDEHKTQLEELNKLNKENQSLKQKIKNLENENTTLNSELSKTKANKISLEKTEKRQQCFLKVASANLVTMLAVGVIFSIAFQLPVLLMIAISVTSALVAGGVTYATTKPTTELTELKKEVAIQQHSVCKT